jgi:MoaA/NifB/PqqE/SkfB family radical SAM enzyme
LGNIHKKQAGFLSSENFSDGLIFLRDKGVIDPKSTHMGLYSWGEPFLHPQFEEMMDVVSDLHFGYSLSTNASVVKEIPRLALLKLMEIKFSMPGFSQTSYDKQHGFNFETICRNIIDTVNYIRWFTPSVSFSLVFQVYESNKHEMYEAQSFSNKLGMHFQPIWAHLTGLTMPTMGPPQPNDFCVDVWDEIKRQQPPNWLCMQYDILVLDEYSNVVQCCVSERSIPSYVLGNIKEIDFENLRHLRESNPMCKQCIESGTGFLAHHVSGAFKRI